MTTPMPKHRWSKYSLPRLLMVVMLVVIPYSWFAVKMRQVKEREAVAALEKLGRRVDWSEPSGPVRYDGWGMISLCTLNLWICRPDVTDADMEHLKG